MVSGKFVDALLDFGAYRKTQVVSASTAAAVKTAITSYISNAIAGVTVGSTTYISLLNP